MSEKPPEDLSDGEKFVSKVEEPQIAPPAPTSETTQTVEIPGPALQAIVHAVMQVHSGPIPDAKSFERYEKTLVGAADRILKMAEKEQECRLQAAPIENSREFIGRMTGQIIGFLSLALMVGCGAYIAYNATNAGQITFACALVAAPTLAAIDRVTDFFRRRK